MFDDFGLGPFERGTTAGAILAFDITLIRDNAGRALVGIYDRDADKYLSLTPAQARQVAVWLRLAALPGKTIAEAKMNQGGASAKTAMR